MTASNVTPLVHPAAAAQASNVIVVASGKGGVGKTWFAATLSHTLANLDRRTLLFDGDIGLANVDVQLGLMPERDLGGVISGQYPLADAVMRYQDAGFDIIPGLSGSGALASLTNDRLTALRQTLFHLARGYDWIVADMGAGIDATTHFLMGPGATVLVVTTDEPTALTDAYAFIKVTAARNPGADLRVVVNLAASPREGQRTYESLKKACKTFLSLSPPLAGVVRRDDKVKDAIRHQTSVLRRHPAAKAAADVEAIARSLIAEP